MIQYAAMSDVGRRRSQNQDRWAVHPELGLFLIADGMGGQAAGDVAAEIVAQALPFQLAQRLKHSGSEINHDTIDQVAAAVRELNDILLEETRGQQGLEGMGATLVMLLVRGDQALVVHLGDSRAYLYRDGVLAQLTRDHTLLQMLLDRGEVMPADAAQHPLRSSLTRFIGGADSRPESQILSLRSGDYLLLCSDGLSSCVEEAELRELLNRPGDVAARCRALIDAGNGAGGRDNITSLVIEVVEPEDAEGEQVMQRLE